MPSGVRFRSTFPWWNGPTTSSVNEPADVSGAALYGGFSAFCRSLRQLSKQAAENCNIKAGDYTHSAD